MGFLKGSLLQVESVLRSGREDVSSFNYGSDFVLASFPKSGSTWTRFFIAAYTCLVDDLDLSELDFNTIENISPPFRKFEKNALANVKCRAWKTHSANLKKFDDMGAVVVFRDPVKVMRSYCDYLNGERMKALTQKDCVKHWKYGVESWNFFHKTWFERSSEETIFIDYDKIMKNQTATMASLLDRLGIYVDLALIEEARVYSSRKNMAKLLLERGDRNAGRKGYNFVSENSNARPELDVDVVRYIQNETCDLYEILKSRGSCIDA